MKLIGLYIVNTIIAVGPPLGLIVITLLAINCYIELYG